jgi:hypothetical protein
LTHCFPDKDIPGEIHDRFAHRLQKQVQTNLFKTIVSALGWLLDRAPISIENVDY